MGLKQIQNGDFILSMTNKVERSIKGAAIHWELVRIAWWLEQNYFFFLPSQGSSLCSAQHAGIAPVTLVSDPYGSFNLHIFGWGVRKNYCVPVSVGISDLKAPMWEKLKLSASRVQYSRGECGRVREWGWGWFWYSSAIDGLACFGHQSFELILRKDKRGLTCSEMWALHEWPQL